MIFIPLALLCLVGNSLQLFPGAVPDEGDYRHLYPIVCLTIRPYENYTHTLSHVLGLVEAIRYPKDRMHLLFFVEEPKSEEESRLLTMVNQWSSELAHLYLSTASKSIETNWREEALTSARRKSCARVLITDSDALLMQNALKQLIDLLDDGSNVVISPLLNAPFGSSHSNVDGLLGEKFVGREQLESVRVYYSRGPLLINLKHKDASYLSFDESNVNNYQGNGHPISVFAFSAFAMNISILINNENFYGYFIDSGVYAPAEHKTLLNSFLANLISDTGPMPFPHSSVLQPEYPVPTTFGFDKIYLINLKRRPERLRKMDAILRLIGLDYTLFEAVDGQKLGEEKLGKLTFLPGYQDPYYKRPMKKGEIGCFLSHYKIWEDVVENKWDRVIVLEDDVRFTENATRVLRGMVEDLMKKQTEWDFIYLGRKKMSAPGDEFFVTGHRYLSTVGYSYWTLGYALSKGGAQKLIDARPLEKMMALDEFLPIMYDKHPNAEWRQHFEEHHSLKAFTVYPVVVQPERYTHEPGYVSDTEASLVVDDEVVSNINNNKSSAKPNEKQEDVLNDEVQRRNFFSQADTTGNDEL